MCDLAQPAHSRDLRSEFEKDYHRIIGSSSFRRLQDKTQVFALDKSDFIRTRLTHSLEVSSFARSLGQNIGECIMNQGLDAGFTREMQRDIVKKNCTIPYWLNVEAEKAGINYSKLLQEAIMQVLGISKKVY